MKAIALVISLVFATQTAWSADESTADMPGYVDFSELSQDYGEPRVMVNLGGSLLKLVGSMKHDDPVAEEALKSLDSVRIHVYNTNGDTSSADARMDAVSSKLADQDWEQIVRVQEPEDRVNVYVKHSADRIQGLMIMAVNAEEAVFVNVLGDIDPAHLNSVVAGIDVVDDFGVDFDLAL
ncbi:MAG: hypothetical protein ACI8RN_000676 [Glaciecola sp.]|jgi:hypothetical protein|uniref:DUF4252 domain-containing protein n=1 Tax=Congregibacter sp. TaxID=2744308 RepID=UPI0039E6CF0A